MRKFTFLMVLVLLILVSFTGCNNSKNATDTNSIETELSYEQQFNNVSYIDCVFILNKNTSVFHRKWCYIVESISEKNKIYCDDTKENVIKNGYIPCAKCKP